MTDIAIMSEMSLREQFEKETGYKLPDVRDYNSFELNVKLADYYERFSGWMKSKCEELQKENTKLKGKYNHLENHANERVHDLHQQLTAQSKELEAWQIRQPEQAIAELTLSELGLRIAKINDANGWTPITLEDWNDDYKITAMLGLIMTECSEAIEAHRDNDFENFGEEMADILIRAIDLAERLRIKTYEEIVSKLDKNENRGHKHGGKRI